MRHIQGTRAPWSLTKVNYISLVSLTKMRLVGWKL